MWVAFAVQKLLTFFQQKNIRILYIEYSKTVNEMTLNELVKLTMLWTTEPWALVDIVPSIYEPFQPKKQLTCLTWIYHIMNSSNILRWNRCCLICIFSAVTLIYMSTTASEDFQKCWHQCWKNFQVWDLDFLDLSNFTLAGVNPCPAEPGYTLPLQTV